MTTNIGLYTGSAGSLFMNLLKNSYQGGRNGKAISQLLEDIECNIQSLNSLSFAHGITGIGWVLEWCNQNHLLNINSDEVLSDIDDLLYRETVYQSIQELSLIDLVGVANYFYIRALSRNRGQLRYRHLCHKECLFLVLEDIEAKHNVEIAKQGDMGQGEYCRFLSIYLLLLSRLLVLKEPSIKSEFNRILHISQENVVNLCNERAIQKIDNALLYVIAQLYESLLIVSRRSKVTLERFHQENLSISELQNYIEKEFFHKNASDMDKIVLYALHYIRAENKNTLFTLKNLLTVSSFDYLCNTFSGGMGIVEIIRFWIHNKQRNNIEELLLLQEPITQI